MTLRVDWFGIVEGAVFDARSMPTLVGFSPQVLLVDSFPGQVRTTVFLLAEDDEDPVPVLGPGKTAHVRLQVKGPDGAVLFLNEQQFPGQQPKQVADLPARVQLLAVIGVNVHKPGKHTLEAEISVDGTEEPTRASRTFRVGDASILDEARRRA